MPRIARTIQDVLLGEATHGTPEERFADLLGIASVIHNRAALHGVTPTQVISAKGQFDAYGRVLPAGVEKFRDLADQAWETVTETGPIHSATYYATPSSVRSLPRGLAPITETKGHQFFIDPQFRPIKTAIGVKPADPTVAQELLDSIDPVDVPIPEARPLMAEARLSSYAPAPGTFDAVSAIEGLLSGSIDTVATDQAAQEGLNALGVAERTDYQSPLGVLGDRVTSDFGPRSAPRTAAGFGSSFHRGLDMAVQAGQSGYPAQAMGAGTISDISSSPGGYGNRVEVTHPDGFVSSYSHLADIADNISIGDEIAAGTPVGTVGSTGRSTGAHLHFEVRDPNGVAIDPSSLFSANPDPSVPTPMAAERMDPNDTLAQSFDMGRFGEQPPSFDMGRFAGPMTGALASALTETNANPGLASMQTADMQERANAARTALDAQVAQSASQMAEASAPSGVSEKTGRLPESFDMGRLDPATFDTGRFAESLSPFDMARLSLAEPEPSYADLTQTVDASTFSQPNIDAGLVSGITPGGQIAGGAKRSVQAKVATEQSKAKDENADRLGRSLTNSKTLGTALGATLGAVLGGPVGAAALGALGGKIGNLKPAERPRETPLQALFNILTGKPQSMFPTAPPGGHGTGKGVTYDDLVSDGIRDGRGIYNDSKQFRDAIDKGGVGLY